MIFDMENWVQSLYGYLRISHTTLDNMATLKSSNLQIAKPPNSFGKQIWSQKIGEKKCIFLILSIHQNLLTILSATRQNPLGNLKVLRIYGNVL